MPAPTHDLADDLLLGCSMPWPDSPRARQDVPRSGHETPMPPVDTGEADAAVQGPPNVGLSEGADPGRASRVTRRVSRQEMARRSVEHCLRTTGQLFRPGAPSVPPAPPPMKRERYGIAPRVIWPQTAREEQLFKQGRRMGHANNTLTPGLALALLPAALLVFAAGVALGRSLGAWP